MQETLESRGPVCRQLESLGAKWGRVGDATLALRIGSAEEETAALKTLALCDLSALPKLGLKGAGAEGWLRDQGIDVPPVVYDTRSLSDGGLIARLGSADFFLEGGPRGGLLPRLAADLAKPPARVYRVERQDAGFVLVGERAPKLLAQLSAFDFRSAPSGRFVLTQAASINCAALPIPADEGVRFRLWVDCSYAAYFWETLVRIGTELGGRVVGALAVLPGVEEHPR